MTKQELRTHWLEHRLTLSESQKNTQSFQIQDLLLQHFPLHLADNVHVFLPAHEKCEVRTWGIVHYIQEKCPNTKVCVPKITNMKNRTMESILVEHNTYFVKTRFGMEEPESGYVVSPGSIDIILLPLITFDPKGHRLGYGGGFYDRYLEDCRKATKIGLSYFEPTEEIPEIHEYDITMDYCVTPEKVYKF